MLMWALRGMEKLGTKLNSGSSLHVMSEDIDCRILILHWLFAFVEARFRWYSRNYPTSLEKKGLSYFDNMYKKWISPLLWRN